MGAQRVPWGADAVYDILSNGPISFMELRIRLMYLIPAELGWRHQDKKSSSNRKYYKCTIKKKSKCDPIESGRRNLAHLKIMTMIKGGSLKIDNDRMVSISKK